MTTLKIQQSLMERHNLRIPISYKDGNKGKGGLYEQVGTGAPAFFA